MKQFIYNPRVWAIIVVLAIAIIALIAIPDEDLSIAKWFTLLFASKAIAAIGFLLVCFAYSHWSKQGKLDGLRRFLDEEEL